MTIARIVDVVWTAPHGERAAMVTEPGTVHILDLPASAFTWPPPRRRIHSGGSDQASLDANNAARSAVGVASSAVSSLWTVARPLSFCGRCNWEDERNAKVGWDEIAPPQEQIHPQPKLRQVLQRAVWRFCLRCWWGIVRIYTVKSRRADRPADKQKASRGAKYVEYHIPSLPDVKIVRGPAHDDGVGALARDTVENWKARQVTTRVITSLWAESSIPQAEIESNAPYQPFHTDRRVSLQVYSDERATPSSNHLLPEPAYLMLL
ncbi:hypothetical protein DID88_006417 [Monilinia fructigena]|uniref:Uncharacterized protein n=1 Tax=Monilinia fructigena TaxID=38457 RepID=A0A395ID56_9HELO|nr:hypothetical protein DID88_006417 [Monilinia fructigena]